LSKERLTARKPIIPSTDSSSRDMERELHFR